MKMETKHKCPSCGGHGINAMDSEETCAQCDGERWITKPEYDGDLRADVEVLKWLDSKLENRPEPKNGFSEDIKCLFDMGDVIVKKLYQYYVGGK